MNQKRMSHDVAVVDIVPQQWKVSLIHKVYDWDAEFDMIPAMSADRAGSLALNQMKQPNAWLVVTAVPSLSLSERATKHWAES